MRPSKIIECTHARSAGDREVCVHLLEDVEADHFQYFTGESLTYSLICSACRDIALKNPIPLHSVCPSCFREIEDEGYWEGIAGQPKIKRRDTDLKFADQSIHLSYLDSRNLVDIQPLANTETGEWIGLTAHNSLLRINFNDASVQVMGTVVNSENHDFTALEISANNEFIALFQPLGKHGIIVETETLRQMKVIQRDGYHNDVSTFPLAFGEHGGRPLLVFSQEWNRLDVCDLKTGELLTERQSPRNHSDKTRDEHYLDYFHGHLSLSPSQEWIVDDGWVWAPMGLLASWSFSNWLENNVWESEDWQRRRRLIQRDLWEAPKCWIDDKTLAVWGYGGYDSRLIPAVQIYDVESGELQQWFPGPEVQPLPQLRKFERRDALIFDTYLFSISGLEGVQVWDVNSGESLLADNSFFPKRYHRGTREFLTLLPDGGFQLSSLASV